MIEKRWGWLARVVVGRWLDRDRRRWENNRVLKYVSYHTASCTRTEACLIFSVSGWEDDSSVASVSLVALVCLWDVVYMYVMEGMDGRCGWCLGWGGRERERETFNNTLRYSPSFCIFISIFLSIFLSFFLPLSFSSLYVFTSHFSLTHSSLLTHASLLTLPFTSSHLFYSHTPTDKLQVNDIFWHLDMACAPSRNAFHCAPTPPFHTLFYEAEVVDRLKWVRLVCSWAAWVGYPPLRTCNSSSRPCPNRVGKRQRNLR